MLKLAKSELYRFFRLKFFSLTIIIFAFLIPIVSLIILGVYGNLDASMDVHVSMTIILNQVIVLLGMPTLLAVYCGTAFNNRMAYYEVMDGNSPVKIIASKIFSLGMLCSIIAFVPSFIYFLVVDLKNGSGIIENPVMTFVLLFVIFCRVFVCTILYTLICKNLVIASLLPYVRFGIIDIVFILVLSSEGLNLDVPDALVDLFITTQLNKLCQPVYSDKFIAYTVGSALVEIAVLFVLAVITYKKKKFK